MDFYAFSAPSHIEVYDGKISEKTKNMIYSFVKSLEEGFSNIKEGSLTYKINNNIEAFANENIHFTNLLGLSNTCNVLSKGKFDPTIYPLTNLWGFNENYPVSDFTPPKKEQIGEILNSTCIGINNISVKDDVIVKSNPNTQLDFGGIIKGYATDVIANMLKDDNHSKGYISLGSSSMYVLSIKKLSIIHPEKEGNIISIKMKKTESVSVSTSGDYQRYYRYENVNYSHIIDPKTGLPTTTNIKSATLIGENGALLDGLSTALILFNRDEIIDYVKQLINSEKIKINQVYIIYSSENNKEIITNAKKTTDFALLDSDYKIVNI
ncbi:MAG: FAD:protein FMN transferase [Clostridia bacterium]|nr:FAD:protein FMN transferase [Clostridia bacterium]